MAGEIEEVECPYCGNLQDENIEDDSFVCENPECEEIFTVERS